MNPDNEIPTSANLSTLTPQQERAAALIADGKSVTATAEALGAARQTVSDWVNHNQAFQQAVEKHKSETFQSDTERIRKRLAPKAIDLLEAALAEVNLVGVQAAAVILQAAGYYNAGASLSPIDLEDLKAGREAREFAQNMTRLLHSPDKDKDED